MHQFNVQCIPLPASINILRGLLTNLQLTDLARMAGGEFLYLLSSTTEPSLWFLKCNFKMGYFFNRYDRTNEKH